MFKFIKKYICKKKGHNFESYVYQYETYPYDIEQAGHCKRCGYDTHDKD